MSILWNFTGITPLHSQNTIPMNKQTKATTIKDDYDFWAEKYDTNYNRTRDLDKRATAETLKKYCFKTVIELGCGTGKNTYTLLNKADKIIGLDFSEKMLAMAKSKFISDRVDFNTIDITQDWKIEDNFADLITCSLVLEHIPNLDIIFQQAKKKLRKDGIFFINELHPGKQYLGSKAKYESQSGIRELETFIHHLSDYLDASKRNGFQVIEINEWFDDKKLNEIPRLISFVFQK